MMRTMIIWLLLNISVAAASTEVAHVPNNSGLGPFSQGSQVQEKALSPVIMGSGFPGGFQEPFMRNRSIPQAEPISTVGVVALVVVYMAFLAIIVWAIVFQVVVRRRETKQQPSDRTREESRVTQFFDDQVGGN